MIALPGTKSNPVLVEGVPDTCIHCDVGQLQSRGIDQFGDTWYEIFICLVCDLLISKEE